MNSLFFILLFAPQAIVSTVMDYTCVGRVTSTILGATTRWYWAGQSEIEERDAADALVRYHVNGPLHMDERVATIEAATRGAGEDRYYLPGLNGSIVGAGSADGLAIEKFDYSATGDFAGGSGGGGFHHDFDDDERLGLRDYIHLQTCFGRTTPECLGVNDFGSDGATETDGDVDVFDFDQYAECFAGAINPPNAGCEAAGGGDEEIPRSGTFTLHGRPIDVIPGGGGRGAEDDLVLTYVRARYYDAKHGRWLQRDPSGYVDGNNQYEAFRGNALSFTDPSGEGILQWLSGGYYSSPDADLLRAGGFRLIWDPIYGFFEGGAQDIGAKGHQIALLPTGESAIQLRLVNLVDAEFAIGGAQPDETGDVMVRAVGQGIVDFFGASSVASAVTGEQAVFGEGGQVYFVDLSAFERVESGVAGVGQFAGSVSGLAGGGITSASQLQLARGVVGTAARVAPASEASQVLFFRAGLAIERAEFALATPAVADTVATGLALSRHSLAAEGRVATTPVAGSQRYEYFPAQYGVGPVAVATETRGGVYLLRNPDTGQVMRTGRTGNLLARRTQHAIDPRFRRLDFEPVYRTDVYLQQRGLEQLLHDKYSPVLNRQRPIRIGNPRRQEYLDAAQEFLNQ